MKRSFFHFEQEKDKWAFIDVERNLRKLHAEPPTPLPKNLRELLKFKPFWLFASGVCMIGASVTAIAYNLSSFGSVRAQTKLPSGHTLSVVRNDITQEKVDAIVNPANNQLHHGGGVAGSISKNGGSEIQKESNSLVKSKGPIQTGQAVVTGPGQLPTKYIIHAVGPVWNGGRMGEDVKLKLAVWNSLERARELQAKSISIPAISSGIFGFPKDRCAFIMVDTVVDYASKHPNQPPHEIRFTNIDEPTVWEFTKEFERTFPGSKM